MMQDQDHGNDRDGVGQDELSGQTEAMAPHQFKCPQCGALLQFAPGTKSLACPYCSHEIAIPTSKDEIKELDFHTYWKQAADDAAPVTQTLLRCPGCGAEVTIGQGLASDACPYCDTILVVAEGSRKMIKPRSLLPFSVTQKNAHDAFSQWLKSLWFAPNALKKFASADARLQGIYQPYWTYDADVYSLYDGQRGDDYYTTEHYTVTVNGKTEHRTRQVRHTRWHSVSGSVWNSFDDILILASTELPQKMANKLEPWDLGSLVPYQDDYLSGFKTQTYQVTLQEGFEQARAIMDDEIRDTIRHDIGGDHQRIDNVNSDFRKLTFKHILLPVWLSGYRYGTKRYVFLVNAQTGEVQGERPYSWVKILLTAMSVILAILLVYLLSQ